MPAFLGTIISAHKISRKPKVLFDGGRNVEIKIGKPIEVKKLNTSVLSKKLSASEIINLKRQIRDKKQPKKAEHAQKENLINLSVQIAQEKNPVKRLALLKQYSGLCKQTKVCVKQFSLPNGTINYTIVELTPTGIKHLNRRIEVVEKIAKGQPLGKGRITGLSNKEHIKTREPGFVNPDSIGSSSTKRFGKFNRH